LFGKEEKEKAIESARKGRKYKAEAATSYADVSLSKKKVLCIKQIAIM